MIGPVSVINKSYVRLSCILMLWGFNTATAFSQIALNARIGKSYHTYFSFDYLAYSRSSDWHNGLDMAVLCDYYMNHHLALSSGIEVDRYAFDFLGPEVSVPEAHVASSTSDPKYVARFLLELKFVSNFSESFRPFFATGFAFVVEPAITVTETYLDDNRPGIWTEQIGFDRQLYLTHGVSVGFQSIVHDDLGVTFTLSQYTNYSDHGHCVVSAGLVYLLRDSIP